MVIPSQAPGTFAALKVGVGFALTGAVIGELVDLDLAADHRVHEMNFAGW